MTSSVKYAHKINLDPVCCQSTDEHLALPPAVELAGCCNFLSSDGR